MKHGVRKHQEKTKNSRGNQETKRFVRKNVVRKQKGLSGKMLSGKKIARKNVVVVRGK